MGVVELIVLILIDNHRIMEELKSLCRKADQSRTIHSLLRDKLVCIDTLITAYVTVGSAASAMLIFAPIDQKYDLCIGLFFASIFITSLIPGTFNLRQKIIERSVAVQLWGKWLRDAKAFSVDVAPDKSSVNDLLQKYKDVMDQTPLIPDKKFNKYKQIHLQKVLISKTLDNFPFKSIRQIKKELTNNESDHNT